VIEVSFLKVTHFYKNGVAQCVSFRAQLASTKKHTATGPRQ